MSAGNSGSSNIFPSLTSCFFNAALSWFLKGTAILRSLADWQTWICRARIQQNAATAPADTMALCMALFVAKSSKIKIS